MRRIKIIFYLLLSLCPATLFSQQTANLEGVISDNETKELLVGVKIYLIGTQNGAYSMDDGTYLISGIKPGTYDILFAYMGYNTDTIKGVKFQAEATINLDHKLKTPEDIKAVVITGEKTYVSEISLVKDIQMAKEVVVGISSEQISKTQDRDASEIMKRVPGVTILDNRFVMIRGLSQRYNSVLLNGAFAPSIEADIRSFSFDLIPSSAIDRMLIYKSPSAELPGDFAGGLIKIFTRNIPEKNSFSVNYSSSYRANTTFNDFYLQETPEKSILGFGSQGLNLPNNFPETVKGIKDTTVLNSIGRSLPRSWGVNQVMALPDQRFQVNFAKRINLGKLVLGNITTATYSNTHASQQISRYEYGSFTEKSERQDTTSKVVDGQYNQNAKLGILNNWALIVNSNHKIEFRNLFNQSSLNQTTMRNGPDYQQGNLISSGAFYKLNRMVYSGQLSGGHDFFKDKTRLEWTLGKGISSRNEPMVRRYKTVMELDNDQDGLYDVSVGATPDPSLLGMYFSKMKESSWFASAGVDQKLKIGKIEPHILTGFLGEMKSREFSARNFGYVVSRFNKFDWNATHLPIDSFLTDERINSSTGVKLAESTQPADSYTSSNLLACGYLAIDVKFFDKLRINGGVRLENNRQRLNGYDNNNDTVDVNNKIFRVLPSFNIAYNLTKKIILRGTGGITLNRPEFRELAPFTYYDFNMNTIYGGNPNLETPSIVNLDFRTEWYPSLGEMITVGAFYKNFTNSIEQVVVAGSTSRPFTYSFENAPKAISSGIELEIRKNLGSWLDVKVIRDISVVANGSLIHSKVMFDSAAAMVQDASRPLQGQSPYIINGGLYYNNENSGLQINAMYNVIGKRILVVGFDGFPSIWETPRHVFDVNISKTIGKYLTLKAGIQDIFNQRITLIQDTDANGKLERNTNDEITTNSRPGSYYTLGLMLKF